MESKPDTQNVHTMFYDLDSQDLLPYFHSLIRNFISESDYDSVGVFDWLSCEHEHNLKHKDHRFLSLSLNSFNKDIMTS